ncbi:HK97 family phage prohead protease [Shewanella sp. MM_2022_3]|uniref:HK97 family phage prohead protease n=1 Tax=Shewanella sp. MM_2022_3 TaxID=2923280 RepID=UPI001F4C47CB|nr:HK97 family phage prohead protease [Shewanella sp. MM_2022_3]MCH7421468.1 HK97 family phage prohead protease [Shewanella sp. MM_2022_3]
MQYREYELDIKSIDELGFIVCYANTFNYVDKANDETIQGAFKQTIADHTAKGTMPKMLFNHNRDEPIGKWLSMEEDAYGLKMTGQLILEVQRAREIYALLKAGAINGFSIGYKVKKQVFDRVTKVTKLIELELGEVSIVPFPCNDQSVLTSIKSTFESGEIPRPSIIEKELVNHFGLSKAQALAFMAAGYKGLNTDTPDTVVISEDNETDELLEKSISQKQQDKLDQLLGLLKAS